MILTGAELSKYFGKETTPREMKDQIIKLLDDWKGQQKEHEKPEKKTEQEKVSPNFGSAWPEDCGALPRALKLWRYK